MVVDNFVLFREEVGTSLHGDKARVKLVPIKVKYIYRYSIPLRKGFLNWLCELSIQLDLPSPQ